MQNFLHRVEIGIKERTAARSILLNSMFKHGTHNTTKQNTYC